MRTKNCDRVTIDIPEEMHLQLKVLAALRGNTMRNELITALQEYLKKYEEIYTFLIKKEDIEASKE